MFFTQKMILVDLLVLQKDMDRVSELIVNSGYFEPSMNFQVANDIKDRWVSTNIEDRKKMLLDFQKYALDLQNFFHLHINYRGISQRDQNLSIPQIGDQLKKYQVQQQYFSKEYNAIYDDKISSGLKIFAWQMYQANATINHNIDEETISFFCVLDTERERIFEDILYTMSGIFHLFQSINRHSIYFVTLNSNMIESFHKESAGLDLKNCGLPEEYFGKFSDNIFALSIDYYLICDREERLDIELKHNASAILDKLENILSTLQLYIKITEVKRSMRQVGHFVVVSGWIFAHRFRDFKRKVRKLCGKEYELVATNMDELTMDIPTDLSNPRILKPFENLVTTFGIPSYHEIDPTPFFAILYTLMYGAMFGDVGQGMILVLFGLIGICLSKKTNLTVPGIMVWVGCSSIFFGFLYGSYFGYESESYNWLPQPIWMNPMHHIPEILVLTTLFGVGVILFSYILGIVNAIRMRAWRLLIFSHKGLFAMFLYITVLFLGYCILNAQYPPLWSIILFSMLTLFLFLERVWDVLIYHHGHLSEWWMGFFDMFEFFLSILTNTLSFVRIGAFALTHSALMMAIFSLQKLATGNLFLEYTIVVLGNIFVVFVEGFIVGIQTLRLEYYEFFMRFFHGTGRKFMPVKYRKNQA